MAASSPTRRAGPPVAGPRVGAELDTRRDRRRLRRQRRSRLLALGLVLACAVLVAYDVTGPAGAASPAAGSAATAAVPTPSASGPAVEVVDKGAGSFSYAGPAGPAEASAGVSPLAGPGTWTGAEGPVAGRSGTLNRYRVAVEDGLGVAPAEFAARVDEILGDPRSWIAGGTVRMQRVAGDVAAAFTVYLASPVTSQLMCRAEGIETDRFTNCRLAGKIVINSARWLTAVPDYGAPLAVYQAYAINHEVGHQLGQGHEDCPGPGWPAPVMQQQTLGLQGCVANAWPYLDGVRYRGPAAAM